MSINFSLNSLCNFGLYLCAPSATWGQQKLPLCRRLSSQTLRYLTDCDSGTAITGTYGVYISTSGHLRATVPAIIASSGTGLLVIFNCCSLWSHLVAGGDSFFFCLPSLTAAGCCLAGTPSGMSFFQDNVRTVTATKQEESAEARREQLCVIICTYICRLQLS